MHKEDFFFNLKVDSDSKTFQDQSKPFISNNHARGNSNIMLTEEDKFLLKNKQIGNV